MDLIKIVHSPTVGLDKTAFFYILKLTTFDYLVKALGQEVIITGE